ncbi:MAG: hypothetical protein OSB19_17165, partial [Opitutaceae bacterium]|nr:hypothetical protein [Opitutaceae bacterium]
MHELAFFGYSRDDKGIGLNLICSLWVIPSKLASLLDLVAADLPAQRIRVNLTLFERIIAD